VPRIPFFQVFKHDVHRVPELFIVFPDFHRVDEFDQGSEVLFLDGGFVVDIPDQGTVQKSFRLRPEFVAGPAVALGVGDKRRDEFQDVFFAADIGEGVVMHALAEVDRIEDSDLVSPDPLEGMSALRQDGTLRKRFVNTENDNSLKKIIVLMIN